MSIQTALWTVGKNPRSLDAAKLTDERLLEDMIVAEPRLLWDDWMLIGRQEHTGHGGIIDLLGVERDGKTVLIELKRDKTPRDVVAQALDYADWVERLKPEKLTAIYGRFSKGGDLATDFEAKFDQKLDIDTLNSSHKVVLVAAALDPASERIVGYLSRRGVPINVLCFQVFAGEGDKQFLTRSWLFDPVLTPAAAVGGPAVDWNGEFYCSFGEGQNRSWEDAREFGFVSAGGGTFYTQTLRQLKPGNRVWVRVPKLGYVGVGLVTGPPALGSELMVRTKAGDEVPVREAAGRAGYHQQHGDDPEKGEWFAPVRWLQTVPLDEAVGDPGLFGNQNTVCKPTTPKWQTTVDLLKSKFPGYDAPAPPG